MYVCMYVCVYLYVCMFVCTYVCVCIYVCVCVCIYVCVCVWRIQKIHLEGGALICGRGPQTSFNRTLGRFLTYITKFRVVGQLCPLNPPLHTHTPPSTHTHTKQNYLNEKYNYFISLVVKMFSCVPNNDKLGDIPLNKYIVYY